MDFKYLQTYYLFSVRMIIDAPRNVDVCIFDGMSLIHSHVDLVSILCGIADLTLFCLVNRAYW